MCFLSRLVIHVTLLYAAITGYIRAFSIKHEHPGGGGGGVYCETETFNATCEIGSAVLLTHALYGRMRQSRCVRQDYGHLGCAADVIDLADARCSARRKCSIRVPDASLATTKPCPDDLKPYLEADYICVRVQTPTDLCDDAARVRVSNPRGGYLANLVTEATGCGGVRAPWLIEAQGGQTVRLTLYDFSLADLGRHYDLTPQYPGGGAPDSPPNPRPGKPYALVAEPSVGRNLTVMGAMRTRKAVVYISVSHLIEVAILTSDDVVEVSYFMLKYEVVGCPDVFVVSNGWAVRVGDSQLVQCNNSGLDVRHLHCAGNSWTGDTTNCTAGSELNKSREIKEGGSILNGTSAAIALLTAITIGLLILGPGLLYLRSRKQAYKQKCRPTPQRAASQRAARQCGCKPRERCWADARCCPLPPSASVLVPAPGWNREAGVFSVGTSYSISSGQKQDQYGVVMDTPLFSSPERHVLCASSPQLLLRGYSVREGSDSLTEDPSPESVRAQTLRPNASARCSAEFCQRQSNVERAPSFNPQTDDIKLSLQQTAAANYEISADSNVNAFENLEFKRCDVQSLRESSGFSKEPIISSDLSLICNSRLNVVCSLEQGDNVDAEQISHGFLCETYSGKESHYSNLMQRNGFHPNEKRSIDTNAGLEYSNWNTL